MATYAIGDIQGCYDSLQRLLAKCAFDPAHDRLWLVGDLVNRGPKSLETLRLVKSFGESALTVLGNHDLYLLMVAEGGASSGARTTRCRPSSMHPIAPNYWTGCATSRSATPKASIAWSTPAAAAMDNCPRPRTGPRGRVGPANRPIPRVRHEPVGQRTGRLVGRSARLARLRVIVNAMTRMRFCTLDGVAEFKAKGKLSNAPANHRPWFDLPHRQHADAVLVTGHWSALGLKITPNLLALDSGCLWGGHLTAVRLEDRQVFQVDCSPSEALPLKR